MLPPPPTYIAALNHHPLRDRSLVTGGGGLQNEKLLVNKLFAFSLIMIITFLAPTSPLKGGNFFLGGGGQVKV